MNGCAHVSDEPYVNKRSQLPLSRHVSNAVRFPAPQLRNVANYDDSKMLLQAGPADTHSLDG